MASLQGSVSALRVVRIRAAGKERKKGGKRRDGVGDDFETRQVRRTIASRISGKKEIVSEMNWLPSIVVPSRIHCD